MVLKLTYELGDPGLWLASSRRTTCRLHRLQVNLVTTNHLTLLGITYPLNYEKHLLGKTGMKHTHSKWLILHSKCTKMQQQKFYARYRSPEREKKKKGDGRGRRGFQCVKEGGLYHFILQGPKIFSYATVTCKHETWYFKVVN
jgi:hypothetical protein